jgi:hypothetical protein
MTAPRLLTHNGETHSITEWAKITGLRANTITIRLRDGWTVERTLTEKASPKQRKGHPWTRHNPAYMSGMRNG